MTKKTIKVSDSDRELTPMEKLADLTRRIVAVPKEEVDKRARAYERQRQQKRKAS